ncbi:DNA cytosine methyltransferase [Streptomyces olivaceus]|uniref:DNA cytosine methyltransferase n=1 Tax=Streptomyces olivaceus TaxID=47716 RepID=UPI0036A3845B
MSPLRIGSLFTGTGALDLAVMDVYDAEVVWHSQYEPPDKNGKEDKNQYAAKILARHWPNVPNLGDITKIDWQGVLDEHGPVDILTGGFPCTDVSSAGRRAGLTPETRSGLWNHMAHAISILQPKLVVIENVEGLLSAPAASDMEPCPYCVGDGHAEPVLRACGAVLGDLASLGFDAEWGRYGADEVGAPHRRRRIIIRAWPAASDTEGFGHGPRRLPIGAGSALADAGIGGADAADPGRPGLEVGRVEPDGPELPAAERGRRELPAVADEPVCPTCGCGEWMHDAGGFCAGCHGCTDPELGRPGEAAADASSVEPERRGVAGVLGSQAAAQPGEGDQRERAGHAAGDNREAAADPQSHGRNEGRTEPARQQGRPDAAERGSAAPAETTCPTCLCLKSEHAPDGLCNGCLHCTDPELGQPGFCPDDCPVCAAEAAADTDSQRDGEEHQGPHLVHGERPADGRRTVQLPRPDGDRKAGDRGTPRQPAGERGSAAQQQADRRTVLDLREGEPDLDWGDYGPAIRRWERVLGRRAPWPTDALGRLSPVFTEWLMGLPDGWVTDTPGLTRPAMLRALGNGVVRQQAAYALRDLHTRAGDDTTEEAA